MDGTKVNSVDSGNSTIIVNGGACFEEKRFMWRIQNFNVIFKAGKDFVNEQKFNFTAGAEIGIPSRWCVYLLWLKESVGVFLKLLEAPESANAVYSSMGFIIKDNNDKVYVQERTKAANMIEKTDCWGFRSFLKAHDVDKFPLLDGCLTININFKIFSAIPCTLPPIVEECATKSAKRLAENFSKLLSCDSPCTDVKIVTKDGKEFKAHQCVLSARSPVFQAMFQTKMKEKQTGIIQLEDFSSKAFEVILQYIYSGKLPEKEEWSNPEVIAEVIYAADKYELTELSGFLDELLGTDVDDTSDVGSLFVLACRFSLKKAEMRLFNCIRKKGLSNPQDLINLMKK